MSSHPLDPIFHPRAVAVVGVPSNPDAARMRGFYHSMLEAGYPEVGGLYPINPKVDKIGDATCYPSLLDTPDPVDHVISQVPAPVVPALVDQCIEKGVRSIHFFTAGFSETGDANMADMERTMVGKLKDAGIRVIGPNCMGLYVPSSRLAFMDGFPMDSGSVFLLSQSGANAGEIVHDLTTRGVRFSKVVSYGNGSDLRANHFLDYAAEDPESNVVAAYVEGVQDGPAFFEALKKCARVKPVVILKGGRTSSGSHAAHSHTGSLAGSIEVFDAVCRQAGALRAETMEELLDLVVACSTNTRYVEGRGVALVGGGGGGFAVLSSDAIDRAGLEVPKLPPEAVAEMREYIPVAGSSVNNPIDAFPDGADVERMLTTVGNASVIDTMFLSPQTDRSRWNRSGEDPAADFDMAAEAADLMVRTESAIGKPVVGILRSGRMARMMGVDPKSFMVACYERGVGAYPSVTRAAHTVAQILDWRAGREGLPDLFGSEANAGDGS